MPQYDIFISYRRSTGTSIARQMKAELKNKFRVFLDFDEIPDGRFDKRILDAIADAPIFMFILSPDCFDGCNDENDWVRKEIEQAIRTNRKIVPINYGGAFVSFPDNVPQFIKDGIGLHQFSKIDSTDLYKESVAKLINERLRPVLDAVSGTGAEIHIDTDADCQVQHFYNELIIAHAGHVDNVIKLKKGRHKLQFVSVEDGDVQEEKICNVEDADGCDFIEVKLAATLKQRREARKKEEERRLLAAFKGYEYVDLGLPSGLLWATCNVGADSPEHPGDYFAWGETAPKESYTWETLNYCNDKTGDSFSKYNIDQKGIKDIKMQLEPSDDAAHVNWGGNWRMPTREEWEELCNHCKSKWTKQNGMEGRLFTSKSNKNIIFLPAAGCYYDKDLEHAGSRGFYWSSSLYPDYSNRAFSCYFASDGVYPSGRDRRFIGFSVRPVASPSPSRK